MENAVISKIKAEIERMKEEASIGLCEYDAGHENGICETCDNLLSFLSTLESEKPEKGIDVTDFCKPIEPSIAKCIADNWWEMLGEDEKPIQDGLEEEINRLWESFADEMEGPHNLFDVYARLASHFAKWQKEQMMKEAVEGTVMDFSSNQPRPQVDVLLDAHKYHTGDKVRIIIIKDNGKSD